MTLHYPLWLMIDKAAIRILHHQDVQKDPSQFHTVFKVEIRRGSLHDTLPFSILEALVYLACRLSSLPFSNNSGPW